MPRPQDPRELHYGIEQVEFAWDGSTTLDGEFTKLPVEGPFPAVILLSGSGPSDRDETIAGHPIRRYGSPCCGVSTEWRWRLWA
ncbi:hypothetical protein E1297_39055 [Roseibium sp. RKSG952]|nr:hypothetical protein [Roseibium sp. RKSG952]